MQEDLKDNLEMVRRIIKNNIEAEKNKDYNSSWEKFKNANYGAFYSNDYTRLQFAKTYGHSIKWEYTDTLYKSILKTYVLGLGQEEITSKQKVLGISQFKIKLERFYKDSFVNIVENYKKERENNKIMLEKIEEVLENSIMIEKYTVSEDDETVELQFNDEGTALLILMMFRPVYVPSNLGFHDTDIEEETIKLFLAIIEKMDTEVLSEGEKGEIQYDIEELTVRLNALESYELHSPDEYEGLHIYKHKYNDVEREIIRSALDKSFDFILDRLEFAFPRGLDLESIEFYQYMNSGAIVCLNVIMQRFDVAKEHVIDSLMELIEKGFAFVKEEADDE